MAGKTLHAHALLRAIKIAGGVAKTAKRLGISETRLGLYLEDFESTPDAVFLRIIDILADDQLGNLLREANGQRSAGNGREAAPK